jgi:hypothetical protein
LQPKGTKKNAMSNQSNDFNTPPNIVDLIKKFWGEIDLDPCSNDGSMVKALCNMKLPFNSLSEHYSWSVGGRSSPMGRTKVFVNPPYAPYYLSNDGLRVLSPKEYKEQFCPTNFKRYTIKDWVRRGVVARDEEHCDCIYLIPARGAGSSVWQTIIYPKSDAICYPKKRYPFWENGAPCKGPDGKVAPGTFDVALVYFGYENFRFKKFFSDFGYTIIQDRST